MDDAVPLRQVRADFDDNTVVVYQAYSPHIAEPALAAGTFVAPFKVERMTWIKPSFLWMMYRCGWALKPGQERVLAVRLRRSGFERALAGACLSHFDRKVHTDHDEWARRLRTTTVRVQWDPERSIRLGQLPHRSLQVGISGAAVRAYTSEWITGLTDVTALARQVHTAVQAGDLDAARGLLPVERPYPLPPDVAAAVGATG
ncbi:DUF4291 domain-containing protein [Pseudonocardia sp. TRM90224]|uniref:DUF4291 domain-containing protein n=1 Tax=Pseudonocardia sp. TRM90224 TaxID=2812678 RepID=UPI001E5535D5|nr:DUF4291 domain-containing protein [Pseudonocardia sp. TRM90224]